MTARAGSIIAGLPREPLAAVIGGAPADPAERIPYTRHSSSRARGAGDAS